jgi:hypothetical protein
MFPPRMQTPDSPDQQVVATKRHVACTVAGEVVILHLDDGVYYGLNEVGTRVWQLLEHPRNVDQIVDVITDEFEVERSQCLSDVKELLQALSERGLVELGATRPE